MEVTLQLVPHLVMEILQWAEILLLTLEQAQLPLTER